MARRSPTNARYQKYQEPAGKTRKSAAAAKPSRKGVNPNAPSPKESGGKKSRLPLDPQTPEFKALRRQWGIGLAAGVVLVLASWGMRALDGPDGLLGGRLVIGSMNVSYAGMFSSLLLGLAYACMFYAIYLDFARMRPLRREYLKEHSGAKPGKPTKKDTSTT